MYREGLVPDLVVSSPAERARQTTLAVCKGLDYKRKAVVWDDAIYEASVEALLGVLSRCPPEPRTVLLVGHNPGLEGLLTHLAGDDLDDLAGTSSCPPPPWHAWRCPTIGRTCPLAVPNSSPSRCRSPSPPADPNP